MGHTEGKTSQEVDRHVVDLDVWRGDLFRRFDIIEEGSWKRERESCEVSTMMPILGKRKCEEE